MASCCTRSLSPAIARNACREMSGPYGIMLHTLSFSAPQPQTHSGLGFPSSIRCRRPVSQAATPWRKSSIAVLSPPLGFARNFCSPGSSDLVCGRRSVWDSLGLALEEGADRQTQTGEEGAAVQFIIGR
jgi:hypothetical protein